MLREHSKWSKNPDRGAVISVAYRSFTNLHISCMSDLSGAGFYQCEFDSIIFDGNVNLKKTIFNDCILSECTFWSSETVGTCDFVNSKLIGCTFDFASWPLSCKSLTCTVDDQLAAQLLYHAIKVLTPGQLRKLNPTKETIAFANEFRRTNVSGQFFGTLPKIKIPRKSRAKKTKRG
jgi:uncharacterized protein YjbI with pentapeptide repeats